MLSMPWPEKQGTRVERVSEHSGQVLWAASSCVQARLYQQGPCWSSPRPFLLPKSPFTEKDHPPTTCPIQDPPTRGFLTLRISVPVQGHVSEGPRSAWPAMVPPHSIVTVSHLKHQSSDLLLFWDNDQLTEHLCDQTKLLSDPFQNKENLSTVTLTSRAIVSIHTVLMQVRRILK